MGKTQVKAIKTNKAVIHTAVAVALMSFQAHSDIIISEYVEGSSNNKAIELYNNGDSTVDLSSYQLKFFFNGNTSAATTISLTGEVSPTQTYVISENNAVAEILAVAQQTNTSSWYNGDDAIVLYNGDTVIDSIGQIGVDPGSAWTEGDKSTKDRTLRRLASVTSGDVNPNDAVSLSEFEVFAKDTFTGLGNHLGDDGTGGGDGDGDGDGNGQTPVLTCGQGTVTIGEVQGTTDTSPLINQEVIVEGVVTADLQQDNELKGFYIQSLTADADANTSEALFVYNTSFDVNSGDLVQVRAKVKEQYGATQLSDVADLINCGTGSVTATKVSLPVTDKAQFEALEHMRVELDQPLYVTDNYGLVRYGQFTVATDRLYQGTQVATPGDAANAVEQANQLKSIVIDDGSTQQNADLVPYPAPELSANNTLRLGDSLNQVTGILTYSFGEYRIHPTVDVNINQTNPRTSQPSLANTGDLKVASFNVLNYFNGDGLGGGFPTPRGADSQLEFDRQRDKTIAAITAIEADVLGLIEVENDGFGANSALQDLVNGVNAASGLNYQLVSMQVDNVGTDAISSAIIYNTDKVELIGTPAFIDAVPFDYGNRAPVAASFKELQSDNEFTFVVTHLRSKGSCSRATGLDQDQGDGQGCWNATRVNAVNKLNEWLQTNPTGVQDEDIIVLGDMNAYAKEDPISQFETLGYNNTISDTSQYSYMFRGRLGSLDHAFVTDSLKANLVTATHWHINADEPYGIDYNIEYKSDYQQANLYSPEPYRASDHDPIILEFKFEKVTETVINDVEGWLVFSPTYEFVVPEGAKKLEVTLSGGKGDADLFVRYHKNAWYRQIKCWSHNSGNEESCVIDNPKAGTWDAKAKSWWTFSGVTLTYRITE